MVRGKLNRRPKKTKKPKRSADSSSFLLTEAYNTLRTNLLSRLATAPGNNIIMVTSPNANEGKTTVCANLAIATAQTQSKVLLIDADMRRAAQHKVFRIPNEVGLSSLLDGKSKIIDCIHEVRPHLGVLPAGPAPPNPSELLSSKKMDILLDKARELYDYIFIDSTSLESVADPLILAGKSVGIVLVSRYGKTKYDGISDALDKLENTGAKLLGLVVNGKGDRKNNTDYSLLKDHETG